MEAIHRKVFSTNELGLIVNAPFVVTDLFIGIRRFDDLDYIAYKKYGWNWDEVRGSLELLFNFTGEKVVLTTQQISVLIKDEKRFFEENPKDAQKLKRLVEKYNEIDNEQAI